MNVGKEWFLRMNVPIVVEMTLMVASSGVQIACFAVGVKK